MEGIAGAAVGLLGVLKLLGILRRAVLFVYLAAFLLPRQEQCEGVTGIFVFSRLRPALFLLPLDEAPYVIFDRSYRSGAVAKFKADGTLGMQVPDLASHFVVQRVDLVVVRIRFPGVAPQRQKCFRVNGLRRLKVTAAVLRLAGRSAIIMVSGSLLVADAGKPLTYRAIYDTMHYAGFMAGFGTDGYLVNVRSALKRIRKKFLALDPAFAEIENFAGVGYSWRRPEQTGPGQRTVVMAARDP